MTLEELLRQGKSFGQGASNSAASTVTGPVDMLAWLLRKGGVPVGDTPIGGEAWMRQKGLMATPENKLAGLLGEGAGLAAPIVAAAKAPEIAGGLLQMGRNLAAPQTMNKQTGAIVYHGSPHKFDKFDSSKIGTGEGAQAYGHGLYQAEAEDVAKQYLQGDGYLYKSDLPDDAIAKMLDWDKPLSQQHPDVQSILGKFDADSYHPSGGDYDANELGQQIYNRLAGVLNVRNPSPASGMVKATDYLQKQGIPGIRYLDGGSRMKTGGELIDVSQKNGQWFSKIRKTPSGQVGDVIPMAPGFTTSMPFKTESEARQWAQQQINGGTSNFVVFPGNEGLLKILERNGGKP